MPIMFNTVLLAAGFQLSDVRLMRHKDKRAAKGRSPYELWRDNRPAFEAYQSVQGIGKESRLAANYWGSFVGTPAGETLFVGIYAVSGHRLLEEAWTIPINDELEEAGSCHLYELKLDDRLSDLIGKLLIDWGDADRTRIQRADLQDKPIIELRTAFKEPEFPGYLNFIAPLSKLDSLPATWITAFQSSRGVYLLTCPKTKEQYVGSATGAEAFWQRWQDYLQTGHGNNVVLKSREPSDYQVSILEVAGSAATTDDILAMERRWKAKLQSQEMGLNRN